MSDWYCPTCSNYVSGEFVTFEEVHELCGTFIGQNWQQVLTDRNALVRYVRADNMARKTDQRTSDGMYWFLEWESAYKALSQELKDAISEGDK